MTHDNREEPTVTTTAKRREVHSWEGVSVAAERYERDLVPALFEPWAGVLVDIAGVGPGDRVLDVACGTGVVARVAARRVRPAGHVCGLDVNEDMLAIARCASDDIEWQQASASRTGLPDASFDAAFCQQGLQFFPDRLAAVREVHRVLAPGGRAVIATWCAADDGDAGYVPIAEALQRHVPDDPDPIAFIAATFGLSDGTEVARLAEAAGFDDISVERRTRTVRFPSAKAWVEAFLGAAPVPSVSSLAPTTRAAITADAATALQPYVDSTGLAFPLHTNIVLCRAQRVSFTPTDTSRSTARVPVPNAGASQKVRPERAARRGMGTVIDAPIGTRAPVDGHTGELSAPVLGIRLAIYSAEDGQSRPHTPDDSTAVACDNVTSPHQTNVCRATTDHKVGDSNPSEHTSERAKP